MEEITKQLDGTDAVAKDTTSTDTAGTETSNTAKETKETDNKQNLSDLLKDEAYAKEHNALVQEAVNNALKLAKEEQKKLKSLQKCLMKKRKSLKKMS